MKKIGMLIMIIAFYSCGKDALNSEAYNNALVVPDKSGDFEVSNNEMIVYYEANISEEERADMRDAYGVTEYKQCECADENLELWIFDFSDVGGNPGSPGIPGSIEGVKETADADERIEDNDLNIKIQVSTSENFGGGTIGDVEDAYSSIVQNTDGATIAILDTGVEYNYPGFTYPYLYGTWDSGCENGKDIDLIGWNFIDDNNNPYDDYYGKHGTAVTYLIASSLHLAEIPFRILPVKVADSEGVIDYFSVLCGFQYSAKNPDVDIINMSFGWYEYQLSLLDNFIIEAGEKILVVTSAGNDGSNNDDLAHYPSSYDANNILAIAAMPFGNGPAGTEEIRLARFSNYGVNSVDFAVRGQDIPFIYNGVNKPLTGTSFSAALGSAYAASLFEEGYSPNDLKFQIELNSVPASNLSFIKYSSYLPI